MRKAALLFLIALLSSSSPLAAQGAAGAAIEGRVLAADSTPVEHATVSVANTSTGERWRTNSDDRGRYFVEYLSVGGPYRLDVQAIGYGPVRRDIISLALGQRLRADIVLQPAALQLEKVTVNALNSAHTGPAQVISDSLIARLPVDNRDYVELAKLSPQVTNSPNGGLSFAGQHDRYNSIQIDGTNNTDPFGNASSGNGTPGWQVGLTAFTPEAVQELQVLSAPFDVRYGNFAGGLVNAVTRSGSNQLQGSILGYFEGSDLAGTPAGMSGDEFSRKELGLTLGTPIVRDKVALFLNADLSETNQPQIVPPPSDAISGIDPTVGLSYASLLRFQNLLRGYGVEPGTFIPAPTRTPTRNLFAKVTAQLGVNSRLAVSYNYGYGNNEFPAGDRSFGSYSLSSTGSDNPETINAVRAAWTTALGSRFSNELVLARVDDRRICVPNSNAPEVSVTVDSGAFLYAGAADGCEALETGHTLWELTDNFGVAVGTNRFTFGVHAEHLNLVNNVLLLPAGLWSFDSLESLAQGKPFQFQRGIPVSGDSLLAFQVSQIGAYVQDQWLPSPRLALTAGLRIDVPWLPTAPAQNATALSELGVNTALTPSGNVLWSPRLGVNYDPSGRGATVLRGGAGFFAGPPAYIWFRPVYGNKARALRLVCSGSDVPAFTLDPANQPTACGNGTRGKLALAAFDPNFKFPQSFKVALGLDQHLGWGVVGTLDFLYTRLINSVQLADANLAGIQAVSEGEGGRPLYGAVDSTGAVKPTRVTDDLRGVYVLHNGSPDRSYSITAQLAKVFRAGVEVSVAYTYTDAKDRMSMDGDLTSGNLGSTPVDGTLAERALRTSFWARPHKVTAVATTDLPFGFRLGVTYVGMSGEPYTYVAFGDPNADGFPLDGVSASNDAIYVPRDSSDVTLADSSWRRLDQFIRSEPCLSKQRGRLMTRNSCHDPWINETSAQLSKRFRLADRRAIAITANVFNLLNLLHSDWGLQRFSSSDAGNVIPLMEMRGYDTARGRGIYAVYDVPLRQIDPDASRWRLQLGATLFY